MLNQQTLIKYKCVSTSVALKDAGFIDSFIENEEEKVYKKIRRRVARTELPDELL